MSMFKFLYEVVSLFLAVFLVVVVYTIAVLVACVAFVCLVIYVAGEMVFDKIKKVWS